MSLILKKKKSICRAGMMVSNDHDFISYVLFSGFMKVFHKQSF